MKHKTLNRSMAAALTAAMLVTVCTGCGMRNGKGATLEVSFENSYASEELKIEGASRLGGGLLLDDTNMLIVGNDEDYNELFFLYNMTDGTSKQIEIEYINNLPKDTEAYPAATFMDLDGHLNLLFNTYSFANDEYKDLGYTLVIYDAEMNVIESKKLDTGEDLNFNEIQPKSGGGYYATMWDDTGMPNVCILDEKFKVTKKISGSFQYIQNLLTLNDGTICVAYQDNDWNYVFGTINEEKGTVEKLEIEGLPSWFNECFPSKTEDYDFYISNSESVFGINLENNTCAEVINWLNSDFQGDYINSPIQLDDGRFLISNYDSNYSSSSLWLLSPRSEEELADIEIISLASVYGTSGSLGSAISKFNRTNDKYRIVVYDYNQFNTEEDYEAGRKKFESDMTSGIVADMIVTNGLSFESLCSKGLFCDLNDYTKDLTEDKYFTNLFDTLEYGGHLYHMAYSFGVSTLAAKTEHVGEGTKNLTEFTQLIQNLPDGMTPFGEEMSRSSAIYQLVTSNINSFVDVKAGTCSFNSPEFVELLEFCNTFPEEAGPDYNNMDNSDWDAYWEVQDFQYINDKTLLSSMYIYDLESNYQSQMQYFDTAPVTLLGYPTVDENDNGGRFAVDATIAISTNSKYRDECWGFFEMVLSDDFQSSLPWTIPVNKTAFDKKAAEALEPDTYTDENGKEVVQEELSIWRGNEEHKVPLMSQEYIDNLKTYISGVTQSMYYDEQIYNIISEEADMFFAGDQSAQQTADMIQSRTSLYLSEQH